MAGKSQTHRRNIGPVLTAVAFVVATWGFQVEADVTNWKYAEKMDNLRDTRIAALSTRTTDGDTVYDVQLMCESGHRGQVELTFYDRLTGKGKPPQWSHNADFNGAVLIRTRISGQNIASSILQRQGSGPARVTPTAGYSNVGSIPGAQIPMGALAGAPSFAIGGIFGDESIKLNLNWSSADFKRFACVCAADNVPESPSQSMGQGQSDNGQGLLNALGSMDQAFGEALNDVGDTTGFEQIGGCPQAHHPRGVSVSQENIGVAQPKIESLAAYKALVDNIAYQNTHYPAKSVRDSEEGDAVFNLRIARDGTINAVEMTSGTGHPVLDAEAKNVFVRIGKFPAIPSSVAPGADEISFTKQIGFHLNN